MKLATTTSEFARLCDTYKERITHVREAGFRYVDLSMYRIPESEELLLASNWLDNVKALKEHAESLGMQFVQAHAPGEVYFHAEEGRKEEIIANHARAMEVCKELEIPNIVVHADSVVGWGKQEFMEGNIKFFRKLVPAMEKTGVNVLVENSTNVCWAEKYFVNTGKEMREFVFLLDHPMFHVCWDTGHANCEGMQRQELLDIGEELYGLHINDNNGTVDMHTVPFLGSINMDDVMHGLMECGYKGYFTFEASNPLRYWTGERREYPEDTRLYEPSLYLQKHIESFMYHVGVHILSSYGCFEE